MIQCNPEAFARCKTRKYCGEVAADACFTEGSECDKFNRSVLSKPASNADRIRAMSDEELAEFLANGIPHGDCCDCWLDSCTDCKSDWLKWLKQPAKEVK